MANTKLKELVQKARDDFEKVKLDDNRTIRYRFGQTEYIDDDGSLFSGLFISEDGMPKVWNHSAFSSETLDQRSGFFKMLKNNIRKNKKDVLA